MDTQSIARPESVTAWQAQPLADLFASLASSAQGLSPAAAEARLAEHGLNIVRRSAGPPLAVQFLLRFRNPLVVLLIASSVVLGWTGDMTSMAITVLLVIASVTLDFVQEHRAERTVERLQATVAATARVLRGGSRQEMPVAKLVPGDVALLQAGDVVPADGRVIRAEGLFVNEAALTGEPYPVERRGQDAAGDLAVLRMGTVVVSGTAAMLVCSTGNATALGAIAGLVTERPAEQPLERSTRQFGTMILRLTFFLVLFVVLVNATLHRPLLESFVFAVALAVGLTPELLPMIMSVTLAHGALRLAGKHVIVKRLTTIYALGGMDVLCTDKTGTLTEAVIRVAGCVNAHGEADPHVLELAQVNSAFATGVRSPLDDALLAEGNGVAPGWRKVGELPFDFERRRVSVAVEDSAGARHLVVKGAPEEVLRHCSAWRTADGIEPMDDAMRAALRRGFEAFGTDGLRVLAIAERGLPPEHDAITAAHEEELAFAGFVTFLDPPRHDAGQAVTALGHAGIAVKILTGDDERVAAHVCRSLGLPVHGTLLGRDIDGLPDDRLASAVEQVNLFCRVSPSQKTRVIRALQARKRVVGFLGDGINDAPALHAADIGISVAGAVGVAREAAALILTRGRLGVLREGVLEGRRTYANIMKYLMMATSSNFGNMLSMAAASLFLPFLPLLPVQILLNNLLYDVAELAIPLDRVDEGDLRRPHVWDIDQIRRFMLILGPLSSVFDILTFAVLLWVLHADAALFRTGWFIESMATQVLVVFVIRTRHDPLRSRPRTSLTLASIAVVALAVALPFTPAGALVGFVPPPLPLLAMLLGLVLVYLVLAELGKRWFYRTQKPLRNHRGHALST